MVRQAHHERLNLMAVIPPHGNVAFNAPAVRYLRRWNVAGGIPTQSITTIKLRVAISQRLECKACLAKIYR
ncbi:MAG: hypothetical protein DM484_21445 [Candidatus Methylumidiphilus alinenensis]|uniref:Uncharacterized protein n=1 Tax=Candidatus Methylumidiphilus alinenensis TaxID=2202197 RepID=A0A2W4QQF2_9GAMM|nr:MAG: hypothetical protein DM484_21445 [Candidatus Methylumidiphilus alinenensis]